MICLGRILVYLVAAAGALVGRPSMGQSLSQILSPISSQLSGNSFDRFEDVESTLRHPDGPRSVEAFLALAAKANPDLFTHFSLMRESQSLQGADPAAPRAIVYGKDARFILTFNGHQDQPGFNHIEMMQFTDVGVSGGKFELKEITFDQLGSKKPVVSEVNPAKCARCHGTDPKPLWEEYDRWPGAYGEDDDSLIDFDEPGRLRRTSDRDNNIVTRHRQHLKDFRSFMASREQHPRYKWLIIPEGTGSPVAPYIPSRRSGQSPLRPNLNLTKHFSELNGKRVARKFADSGQACFDQGAPLAAAFLLDCDAVDSEKVLMKSITEGLLADQKRHSASRPAALDNVVWSSLNPSFYNDGRVSLLEIMGFSDFDWTPARQKRQWQYFQGFKDASDDILAALWPELQARTGLVLPPYDVIRAELHPQYYQPNGDSYNSAKRELACKNLGGYLKHFDVNSLRQSCLSFDQDSAAVPAVVAMCMSCHDGGYDDGSHDAPALPLDDSVSARANPDFLNWIFERVNSDDPEQRMPPTRPLTGYEYQQLVQFYQRSVFY